MSNNDISKIQLLQVPDVFAGSKFICVQPHHDDLDIGTGGLIIRLSDAGKDITYLTVTDGFLGIPGKSQSDQEKFEIRRKEQSDSSRISGILRFVDLGYKDKGDYSEEELEHRLIELIRYEKPDMIVGPDPLLEYESHSDHIKTGRAVLKAAFNCGVEGYPNGATNQIPHSLRGIILYYTSKPNAFFDITDVWDKKTEMIRQFKSQFSEEAFGPIYEYLECKAREHGKRIGVKYAEGLRVMPVHALHCMEF